MIAFENLYRDQFALSTHLRELSFLVINNSLFFNKSTRSIVQCLLVTVYDILCNTVYFIITLAYGLLSKKNLKVDMALVFYRYFPQVCEHFLSRSLLLADRY